jgi:3-phosphoshikimate 1-carboxyvinyltransferase
VSAQNPESSLTLQPWTGRVEFRLGLPGSKSLTLRDCAIAALADGESKILFPGECDDYWRMKECLQRLEIEIDDRIPEQLRVVGRAGRFAAGPVELFTGQSAVSTRLLLAMAALRPELTSIDGHVSMQARPNKPLLDALIQLGARVESSRDGYLPARVVGSTQLAGPVQVPSDISSQYLTSLLIIAPLLPRGLEIQVAGKLTSKPYVDLTLDEMEKFGVQVENRDYSALRVAPAPSASRATPRRHRTSRRSRPCTAAASAWRTWAAARARVITRSSDCASGWARPSGASPSRQRSWGPALGWLHFPAMWT